VSKDIVSLALPGTSLFYDPADLTGPGKGGLGGAVAAGYRLTVQPPGNNVLTHVRQGELVSNGIFFTGLSATAHPKLVLRDRYQIQYQSVEEIVSQEGQTATYLGKGNLLPNLASITGFSYFDKNGELYIFNPPVQSSAPNAYQNLFIITKITAASGYITNTVGIFGKLVVQNGVTKLVPVAGTCGDHAESAIFKGTSTVRSGAAPIGKTP
jgi:hypothetical protein